MNDFITVKQAAEKWGISDRRVRILCSEGKILGVKKEGRSYLIPAGAVKPSDGRYKEETGVRYLKWENEVIGIISTANEVSFRIPHYNEVVSAYTRGASSWTAEQFTEFLAERVVSRDRRDIERILFRCGLSHYDVLKIAEITKGIHPKDMLWIADAKDEPHSSAITSVFESVFLQKIDLKGDTLDTPEGYNIKRYGVYNGRYGIYKQRISPLAADVESEIAVYLLAEKMGIPCCPAYRTDDNTIFSEFLYDFSKEYIVHFRRLFDGKRGDDEYQNLVSVRPQYRDDFIRMIVLDFITRQDDRHLSNIAITINSQGESFYPLYDNGRSLFYEDTERMVSDALSDPAGYATSFGYSGTYWDYILDIAEEGVDFSKLMNLSVSTEEVAAILKEAGFEGYRYDGALQWICLAMEMVRKLCVK